SAGQSCATQGDCPGGECGPGLFDFASRAEGGGPVVIDNPHVVALDPVPLDGLQQNDAINVFVLEEGIANEDLNGDGDSTDHVIKLADRTTGAMPPLGVGGGRAVARIQQPPFSFPAVASDQSVVAFLEPEFAQFGIDANGDGDIADTMLR